MDEHIDRELHDIEKHKQRERARARKCANHGVSVKELHDAAVSPLLGPVKRTEALVVEGAGIGTAPMRCAAAINAQALASSASMMVSNGCLVATMTWPGLTCPASMNAKTCPSS